MAKLSKQQKEYKARIRKLGKQKIASLMEGRKAKERKNQYSGGGGGEDAAMEGLSLEEILILFSITSGPVTSVLLLNSGGNMLLNSGGDFLLNA